MKCDVVGPVETPSYPPIYNEMPASNNQSCYNASDPCSDRYPFSENWENINPVTIRLNFHFIKTGDVGLNFGEEDGNCPNCSSNDDRSIYDQAEYFLHELNSSAMGMNDFLQYYDDNGNELDPPIRFKDESGNEVPNLGDTKLRFELYEEDNLGSVHIHEIDEYKFEHSVGDMEGPCEDGQITLDNPKADFSVYGDKVIDIFFYDEWSPVHGYDDSEGNFRTCRVIRGSGYQYDYFIELTNLWYLWQYTRQNEPNSSFGRWTYRSILWHELGHVFGLYHTFPTGGCCDANENGLQNEFGSYNRVTNNTMGYNPHFVTFSPCQLEKIFNRLYNNDFQWAELDPNFDSEDQDEPLTPVISIDGQTEVTWDQDVKVTKHIFVESGSRLNIDAEIRMSPGAHIMVKRGAMLEIKNGAKLTNLRPNCERWGGIWVMGNKDRNHPDDRYAPFAADGQDPGRLVVNPDAVIENARWGVNSGLYFWLPYIGGNDPFWPSPWLLDPGGYIYADGATFKGCDQGVRFLPYDRENKSKLYNCEFINSFFAINPIKVGVAIDRNFGIEIKGCKFQRISSHGILLKDASFNIHNNCEFKKIPGTAISALYTSITPQFNYLYNIGKEDGNASSSGNTFEDNLLDIRIESYPLTRNPLKIKGNSFKGFWDANNPDQNQTKNIEVFNSFVSIQNNDFDDVYHNISLNCRDEFMTEILDNDFINFHTAIWYEELGNGKGGNHETQFACNSFYGNNSSGVLIDKSGINNQGGQIDYNDNRWYRDVNQEPIPQSGVYDIRVNTSGGVDPFLVGPVFTYSIKQNTPSLDPIRPLCNLTSGHPNCQLNQNYQLFENAQEPVNCNDSDSDFTGAEILSADDIRDKLDSMDQYGNDAVVGFDYRDLEGRLYRLIKGEADSLLELNQFNAADSLLSLEDGVIYDQHRLGIRLYHRAYDEARTLLNSINGETTEVADFKTVQHLHIDFLADSTYTLDSNDISTLENIAVKRHIPSSHARALLSIIDGRSWDPVFPSIEEVDSVELRQSDKVASGENKTVVFPNPSDGLFTIIPNSETFHTDKPLNIQVYDITGHRVFESQQLTGQKGNIEILLRDVAKGMYLLQIKQEGVHETIKIIKQ